MACGYRERPPEASRNLDHYRGRSPAGCCSCAGSCHEFHSREQREDRGCTRIRWKRIPQHQLQSLKELCIDMNAGKVDTLLILGGNPVYTAPVDYNFAANLSKVPLRIRLGLYEDETSDLCHWNVPEVHSLEAWSDARAYDGTTSIVQPLIAPLYEGCRSAHEIGRGHGRPCGNQRS